MANRCWLMKSEPESFGIDDLERVKIEPWTGVRNFQARNFMRDEMQVGDEVLFYHSNAEPPGVAGFARVHRTAVVDDTQFDPDSKYYDPKARRDAPLWICVDVAYVATLPRLLSLDELRAEPSLSDMLLLRRGMRLSVQPVSPAHFAAVKALATAKAKAPTAREPAADARAKARDKSTTQKKTKTKTTKKTKTTTTTTNAKPRAPRPPRPSAPASATAASRAARGRP